jgi:hypothetical protein
MLLSQGATATGNNNDMWFEVLGNLGYTGALNDRLHAFYLDGYTFGGGGGNNLLLNDGTGILLNDGTNILLN